jgi:CRISPR/Cas system CSM-associated protein Csm3 (group 7 of RAMP superfamily)
MKNPLRYIARVTIEFQTPFIIGGGEDDCLSDSFFVIDMNGLPTIPGSSIAGVLKSRFKQCEKVGAEDVDSFFGYQAGTNGTGSMITVSWACIHDKDNVPAEGLIDQEKLADDVVLNNAVYALTRDHVRIEHRGTAEHQGKFDEKCVPAGHRFTFEMMLEGAEKDHHGWQILLGIIASGAMRLGGRTRQGLGSFKVNIIQERCFDLRHKDDYNAFLRHPVELSKGIDMPNTLENHKGAVFANDISLTLPLLAEGFWMVGGGLDEEIDITPVKAARIVWGSGNTGSVGGEEIYLPGTALKGPLSHRVAYYFDAFKGMCADKAEKGLYKDNVGEGNEAVRELFGYAKQDEETGQPGNVFIDDLLLGTPGTKIISHVSIDRFTGGARTMSGALFSEAPVYRGKSIPLKITITDYHKITDSDLKKAFYNAIRDLAEGQLAIGSGSGRGNGFFLCQEFLKQAKDAGLEVIE